MDPNKPKMALKDTCGLLLVDIQTQVHLEHDLVAASFEYFA
jgi:hypothetical protein